MANAISPYEILIQEIIQPLNQVATAPIYASSSWFDGEILNFLTAANSNVLQQGPANPPLIVGVAMGGSANTLAALVGSGSPPTLVSDNIMGTISNQNQEVYKAIDVCPFEATLLGKVLAQTDLGAQYGLTRTPTGTGYAFWTLDGSKTNASNVRAAIVGFQNSDVYHGGIGDSGARCLAKIIASYSYWEQTGFAEF